MKKFESILFDLDGTLTESGIGITRCAGYALEKMGLPSHGDLNVFIGPPLRQTFLRFGVEKDEVDEAIRIFRSRYTTIGKFENKPYDGIEDMLIKLKQDGYHLFVATSKPETVAKEILEHFHLAHYFEEIAGASLDASRESKSAVIAYLLDKIDAKSCVMIGDTNFDVIGANKNHIPCIGVRWGYGKAEEMIKQGAILILDHPNDIFKAV